MRREGIAVFFMFLVLVTVLVVAWLSLSSSAKIVEEDCVDVNHVASFIYDVCYDASSKTIFMDVERKKDSYDIEKMKFSFFDFKPRNYEVLDVPLNGQKKSYKIFSLKNPRRIEVSLDVIRKFSAPVCEEPRRIFVDYCPVLPANESVKTKINPLTGKESGFILVGDFKKKESSSDIFSGDLVSREAAWEISCASKWRCSPWESCIDGLQRRFCEDLNKCAIPTGAPAMVRKCQQSCVEDWVCEWSDCIGGYTTPKCYDKNNCGTKNKLPTKLKCESAESSCVPNVVCDEWSSCELNYNFVDLIGDSIAEPKGIQSRVCRDLNGCAEPRKETRECALSVDVYTKEFRKCGIDYLGVYNKLTDELLAKIELGPTTDPYVNIDIGPDAEFCDYCYDGVKDGDETGIDCGGSCMSCSEKYGAEVLA
ncbi:hypothetical protein D6829_00575 [Candidatus Pacearchaeota archaeon]|nr:MAG: hypothetical protein D6829_00575 [Candidatus Pacearchaeota archaeon]